MMEKILTILLIYAQQIIFIQRREIWTKGKNVSSGIDAVMCLSQAGSFYVQKAKKDCGVAVLLFACQTI